MGYRIGLSVAFMVLACGPTVDADPDDETGTAGTESPSTSSASATASSSVTNATMATSVGEVTGTVTTIADTGSADGSCPPDDGEDEGPQLDVGPPRPECSTFEQDCEKGEKCMPDHFWTRICVPLDPDPIPDGEACEPAFDADPCGPLAWCGFADPKTGLGTCTPMCTGSFEVPECPQGLVCIIDDENVAAFCQVPCDPFAADPCPGFTCVATPTGFGCLPSGNQGASQHCYDHDSCAPGLVCEDGDVVPGCCNSQCCTPVCSNAHPCAVGTCVPYGLEVPGREGIGYCAE